ncbi:MAG: type II toxin-antitoxin system HipA family toxin [Bdellovibrionaceae bacterium]|nr:type II toxin-antitoxin system HipA family toxin [Pseudobdellovibrionaceae bacterium]
MTRTKRKSIQRLHVYLNSLPLGTLEYKARKSLVFTYQRSWLERAQTFPISRSLPLREDSFEGDVVFAYFDNLLPDGVSIRQRIAARMSAISDQVFDLLAVVGRDCVGALQFTRPEEEPPQLVAATGTPLTEADLIEKLVNLRAIPLAASQEEDFRLSIAGVQKKTAFLQLNGRWHVPRGATPTTHIFKPQIGELKPGLRFFDSVENEWLCAQITAAFGLPTAECAIRQYGDVKVLVVKRFDRTRISDGRLIRIPQEDLCQALAVPNFEKYESAGGPSVIRIMDLLNESKRRDQDRLLFMKTQVVFFLLAAIDGHAKNFSIRWSPSGFDMTPLYDVLSAQPMVDKGGFQIQKLKMAMAYGENRHYKLTHLSRRHFIQSAKLSRYAVSTMDDIINSVLEDVPNVIDTVSNKLPKDFPVKIAESIFKGIRARAEVLRRIQR